MKNKNVTWLSISKEALLHNVRQFRKIVSKNTQIMAVVKSNAYGHGIIECAKIFKKAGCDWLGTVNLNEALLLRKNGIKGRILVLSYFHPDKLEEAIKKNITLTIYYYKSALLLNQIGKKLKKKVKIHFKADTGTSRLGVLTKNCLLLIKRIKKLDNIEIEGIFSHLADSENPDQIFTNQQINKFEKLLVQLTKVGINIPIKHIGCSASTLLNRRSHFNLVRLGISLYGLWSVEKNGKRVQKLYKQFNLLPALSWYTSIIQIKELPAKAIIGYGCTYKTTRKTKIALMPVGYWDGYDRNLSNQGEVLISGKRCKIRGRVCMNLTIIDVTEVKDIRVGDRVTLIGSGGKDEITADELANRTSTINYEIITRINPLIPRVYY